MGLQNRKIGDWTSPVTAEADRPSRGAAEMKGVFDANSNQIKAALNGLIDDLITGGAEDVTPEQVIAAIADHTHTPASIGAAPALLILAGTLLAASWVGTEAPYSQTVSVTGMTAGANGVIGLPASAAAAQREAARGALLFLSFRGADSVTIVADGTKPSIDLPFELQIGG